MIKLCDQEPYDKIIETQENIKIMQNWREK